MISKREYNTVHQWRKRNYPKSGICEHCKVATVTQWANVSGKYLRDDADWLELCIPCHEKYDYEKRYGKPKAKLSRYAQRLLDLQ